MKERKKELKSMTITIVLFSDIKSGIPHGLILDPLLFKIGVRDVSHASYANNKTFKRAS